MLFLLRSLFWLTIVFSSMSWSDGDKREGAEVIGAALRQGGAAVASATQQAAFNQVETQLTRAAVAAVLPKSSGWCTQVDDVCAKDAGRLNALFAANSESFPSDRGEAILPLPPTRPRGP